MVSAKIEGKHSYRKEGRENNAENAKENGSRLILGGIMCRILVDAAPGFAAEPPGFDVLHQQWSGAVFVPEGFVQVIEDA